MIQYFDYEPSVLAALQNGEPVVALESTIIAHGMPYPRNIETALAVQEAVRKKGAVPATIGILDGRIKVGMREEEIRRLAEEKNVVKVSRRDFPYVISMKQHGATTVAGTMMVAEQAGIRVFVTGGIGGVHRGAGESFDISADLDELQNTDVVVVCAGVKSILDIGATLEYLETKGVPVISFGTSQFPAFYSRQSGFQADCRMDDPIEIARLIHTKYAMNLRGGMVVACPIPEGDEIPYQEMEDVIDAALRDSRNLGITGKRVTPFILDRVKTLTEGMSLDANVQLVIHNAEIGSEIARNLAHLSV